MATHMVVDIHGTLDETLHMKNVSPISHSRPWITSEDTASVTQVLASGMVSNGEIATKFEDKVASFSRLQQSYSRTSGTDALISSIEVSWRNWRG